MKSTSPTTAVGSIKTLLLIAVTLICVVPEFARAAVFTGRYNIVSLNDRGVTVSGHLDFRNALVTNQISPDWSPGLEDVFVSVSGPGFTTITANRSDYFSFDSTDQIVFDGFLGAPRLTPLPHVWNSLVYSGWHFSGDLEEGEEFQLSKKDSIHLEVGFGDRLDPTESYAIKWRASVDFSFTEGAAEERGVYVFSPHPARSTPSAWWLELGELPSQLVPEPSTLALLGLGLAGLGIRRMKKAA